MTTELQQDELKMVASPALDFQFTHSPLMNKVHLIQIDLNLYLKSAMERDLTDEFYQDLDFRVENERNFDIVVAGETGSGKSRLSQAIYWETFVRAKKFLNHKLEFTCDNICFTRTEWLTRTEKLQAGDTLIFDEDDQTKIGTGSLRQLTEQERIEKTLRQSQYNFIFCSPIIEQHVEHYILRAFDIEFKHQLNRAVLYKKDEMGLILPYGHIIMKRHEVDGYEEKKKRFRQAVQDRNIRDRFIEYDDVAKILTKKFNLPALKKRTQKSLIQRFFPRFVEEEVKEIMVSVELQSEGIDLNYSEF